MEQQVKSTFERHLATFTEQLNTINSYTALYKHLYDKRSDSASLDAMNKAPAFFSLTIHAFQHMYILGIAKICEERSKTSVTIFSFLDFIENNYPLIFNASPLRSTHEKVDSTLIQAHRDKLAEFADCIKHITAWRDKSFAHSDKQFLGEKQSKLSEKFPITYGEIKALIELISDIINTYSAAYFDKVTSIEATNLYDIDKVLNILINQNQNFDSIRKPPIKE